MIVLHNPKRWNFHWKASHETLRTKSVSQDQDFKYRPSRLVVKNWLIFSPNPKPLIYKPYNPPYPQKNPNPYQDPGRSVSGSLQRLVIVIMCAYVAIGI